MMETYKKIRQEMREKNGNDSIHRKQLVVLEQAIFKDLMEKDPKCVKCGSTEKLTLEHIVPKIMLMSFGLDPLVDIMEGNYALTCKRCNVFKANRLDFTFPETKEVLLKLIATL